MVRTAQFTEVRATHARKGLLSGPHSTAFEAEIPVPIRYGEDELPAKFTVQIDQGPHRQIAVRADEPVYWASLLILLHELEQMIAIFDGSFVPIGDIHFACPDCSAMVTDADSAEVKEQALKQRLRCYASSNWSRVSSGLVDFWDVLTPALFECWHSLVGELDIVNQVYLYALSDNGMPADLNLALLIELAEPMVEIVNDKQGRFPSLQPGARGTSLKQCLNALINAYGLQIFNREVACDYDYLLRRLVASRVRIMHIKRNQEGKAIVEGSECVYYLMKLSLLYRVILLNLLGIPENVYAQRLKVATETVDGRWQRLATEGGVGNTGISTLP